MTNRQFLIVHHATAGNAHDAEVLVAALRGASPGCHAAVLTLPEHFSQDYRSDIGGLCPRPPRGMWDSVFLIECARYNPPLLNPGFAKRYVYVPHVEWVRPVDEASLELGAIDTVIHKNETSHRLLAGLACMTRVSHQPVTGWTSRDPGLPADPWAESRFSRFLHARGVSHLKQTDIVVETWLRHPDWPRLTVTAYVRDELSFPVPLTLAPNISVVLRRQSDAEIGAQIERHGVHVMPSLAEGFGHALNEARAAGALLVTTDAPPMSDLVDRGRSGALVETRPENAVPHHRSFGYPVEVEALERAIEQVLAMPLAARADMGRAGRAAYERDREAFHRAIAALEF